MHPVDRLLRAGLAVTVSTDARTTADTTLTREFADLRRVFGWTDEQEERCRHNAQAAAFTPATPRDRGPEVPADPTGHRRNRSG